MSPGTGFDQDASRMSVKVRMMVGDLVLSLVVVLSDVLKSSLFSLVVVLNWVCVPTLELFEVGL